MRERRDEFYDLEPTHIDQMYKGMHNATPKTLIAIKETRGEVIMFSSEPIIPYYHSTCGGSTEESIYIWGNKLPYITSVRCSYDKISPSYRWKYSIEKQDFADRLRGYGIKTVDSIRVIKRSPTGRAIKIEIKNNKNVIKLSGEELRQLFGYNSIKSTLFDVEINRDRIIFTGKGSGHGVGMCQWGAQGMALNGFNHIDILKYYYKNIEIKKVY